MKTIEEKLGICPYADRCATEYGDDPACQDENMYEMCSIYREYKMESRR